MDANEVRKAVEKRIVMRVVDDLLAAGFAISLDNGGDDYEIEKSTDRQAIENVLFEVDDERLRVTPIYAIKPGEPTGWVYLVYGNDGWDVINDYTTNLETVLAGALALTEAEYQKSSQK